MAGRVDSETPKRTSDHRSADLEPPVPPIGTVSRRVTAGRVSDSPASLAHVRCSICKSPNRASVEQLGEQASAGGLSWRQAARQAGVRADALKRHMELHLPVQGTDGESLVEETVRSLTEMYATLPPDVRPLLLVVIHNLRGLASTAPSQGHLVNALKTLEEVAGLKVQNRLLLEFAKAAFKPKDVIDVESAD